MTDTPESTQIWMMKGLNGPLLNDTEIAEAFATLILERLYGKAELAKQRPLHVIDQGADWIVKGSYRESGEPLGTGAWFIKVRKSDCRVEEFGHYRPLEIPDEVKQIIAKAKESERR